MNEFKKALEEQDHAANEAIKAGFPFWDDDCNRTIRKALLIADKLVQEPSDDDISCYIKYYE